jgi:formylglycine-generating enzyme required for sulfatase activity
MALADAAAKPPVNWREPLTGIEFVKLPKGCYQMGNKQSVAMPRQFEGLPTSFVDLRFIDELPQHEVCVDSFWIGRTELRADQWATLMGGKAERPDAPAADISWEQAQTFAARLTERSGGKVRFRLPTEAEWEYACRAGAAEELVAERAELQGVAWYGVEPDGLKQETQPVGQLQPNAFGLYDMLGNVWEWTLDAYSASAYRQHGLFNPVIRNASASRVIRGASYRSQPVHVRCAKRGHYPAQESMGTIGLRLVRSN